MRIVLLYSHNCPWNNALATTLKRMGHAVHCFAFEGTEVSAFSGSASDTTDYLGRYNSVHLERRQGQGKMRYLTALPSLQRVLRKRKPDVLLSLYGGGLGLMCFLCRFRPYVLYAVGSDILLAGSLFRRLNRWMLTRAAHVFANGQYLAEEACKQAPLAVVEPLLMGINIKRLKMGFPPGAPRIINHRTFDHIYNNESIIKALAAFPVGGPDFEMVFVSAGPQLDEAIRLADAVLPAPIRKRVKFWKGDAPHDQILHGLADSHLYVSMSRSDGTSTATLEAMGSGLFPILSDIPQNRALVSRERANGTLVPLDDIPALTSALTKAIGNLEACRLQAAFNRDLIARIADSEKNLEILNSRLQEVVSKNGNGTPGVRSRSDAPR